MASREIKQLDNLMDGAVAERFNAELKRFGRTSLTIAPALRSRAITLKFVLHQM